MAYNTDDKLKAQAAKNKAVHKAARRGETENSTQPFENAQEAWFWFITAQEARNDGARFVAGQGLYARPCEPLDILKIIDGLYRKRRLVRDHLLVLRHYGRRHLAPDPHRAKEMRAFQLWTEALERMTPILERKSIIQPQKQPHENWVQEALVFENQAFPSQHRGTTS